MNVSKSYTLGCQKCSHQTVCRWDRDRRDLVAKIEEVVKDSNYLAPFTIHVDCTNFEARKDTPRNGGDKFTWTF